MQPSRRRQPSFRQRQPPSIFRAAMRRHALSFESRLPITLILNDIDYASQPQLADYAD